MWPDLDSGTAFEVGPLRDSVRLVRVLQQVGPFEAEYEVIAVCWRLRLSKLDVPEHQPLLWPYPSAFALAVRF